MMNTKKVITNACLKTLIISITFFYFRRHRDVLPVHTVG
jgi:hypothetical protein